MPYITENATENSHKCGDCDQSFCTNRGLSQHQRTFQTRNNTSTDSKDAQEELNVEVSSQNSVTIEDNLTIPCAKYMWGRYKDYDFKKHLSTVYENTRVLKENSFLLPFRKTRRKFIDKVSRLMSEWLKGSPLKSVQSNNGNVKSVTSTAFA